MESLGFTFVSPRVSPLYSEDGEGLAICGQLHALTEHQGEIVEDPGDGNVSTRGATAEGHVFPLFRGSVLADGNGGSGQQFCAGRERGRQEQRHRGGPSKM